MYNDGEEAGGFLCSLTGMVKIHISDSGIKVHVQMEDTLYVCTVQRSGVHCHNIFIIVCYF